MNLGVTSNVRISVAHVHNIYVLGKSSLLSCQEESSLKFAFIYEQIWCEELVRDFFCTDLGMTSIAGEMTADELIEIKDVSASNLTGAHSIWLWCNISFAKKGHREAGISQSIQLVFAPGSRDSLGMSGEQSLLAGEEWSGDWYGGLLLYQGKTETIWFLYTSVRNSILFLRYEYANCRGFLLKIINHSSLPTN